MTIGRILFIVVVAYVNAGLFLFYELCFEALFNAWALLGGSWREIRAYEKKVIGYFTAMPPNELARVVWKHAIEWPTETILPIRDRILNETLIIAMEEHLLER